MTAICIITNCRRRAPSAEPYCAVHRDSDEHRNGEDGNRLSGEAMPARAEGIAQDADSLTKARGEQS